MMEFIYEQPYPEEEGTVYTSPNEQHTLKQNLLSQVLQCNVESQILSQARQN